MSRVTANGVEFQLLSEGPEDGPLALCLHGFPDSAFTFRFLLPKLGRAGFHAVAPFMRGYAPTAVPEDGRYDLATLAGDANRLHEALGGDERAVLIGHDWGAGAAYGAAASEPERWRRTVVAAWPPAGALAAGFLQYDQIKRSFYVFFFQTPIADIVVPMDDMAFIERLWEDWSPGYDAAQDLDHVRAALGNPANLTAALGYYRAIFASGTPAPGPQPTLYLHGARDGCIGVEVASDAEAHLPDGSRAVVLEDAGHFLHLEAPAAVNELIVDWVAS